MRINRTPSNSSAQISCNFLYAIDFLPVYIKNTISIAGIGYYLYTIFPGLEEFNLIFALILVIPIWFINSFRMWTAFHVFIFGLLPYIFENKKDLPTFNSNAIEANFDKIETLNFKPDMVVVDYAVLQTLH